MIIKIYNHKNIRKYLNFSMFDWLGKNGDESGKSQGILISHVSGNPDIVDDNITHIMTTRNLKTGQ